MTIWYPPELGRLTRHSLEPLVAVYDAASGQTHLLAEPLPQILDALTAGPTDSSGVTLRLAATYGTQTDAVAIARIAECLDDLAAMGLIHAGTRAA